MYGKRFYENKLLFFEFRPFFSETISEITPAFTFESMHVSMFSHRDGRFSTEIGHNSPSLIPSTPSIPMVYREAHGIRRVSIHRPTLLYHIILDNLCDSDNVDLSRVNIILKIQIVEISW